MPVPPISSRADAIAFDDAFGVASARSATRLLTCCSRSLRLAALTCVATTVLSCGQSGNGAPEQTGASSSMREGNSVVYDKVTMGSGSSGATLVDIQGSNLSGAFGPLMDWPLIPIHAALTPDGRLMTFGRDPDAAAEMVYDVWDWSAGGGAQAHLTLPNRLGTDLFCSNQLLLTTGEVLMSGGDIRRPNASGQIGSQLLQGNRDANVYDPVTQTLSRRGLLTEPRWYASMTMLPWGEVFIQGGAIDMNLDIPATHVEIASLDGSQYRALTGFRVDDLPWYYPRNFADRHGQIVGWTHNRSYRIDPRGDGQRLDTGLAPGVTLNNGSLAVMYAPGQVLLAGGGSVNAVRADVSGEYPAYEPVPPMQSPRLWGTATVLPDGQVLVSNGGDSDTSIVDAGPGTPALQVTLYDPASNTWRAGASSTVARLYHSTAILLPDASVLMGGGGLPGPYTNLNAEIYYPPYLFGADGSFAARPVIQSAPTVLAAAQTFTIDSPDSQSIDRVVFVKTGAVTHSFDMDQRFVELPFTVTDNLLSATLPAEAGQTPPGFYHLFVLNSAGVPSVSKIVRMNKHLDALLPLAVTAPADSALGITYQGDRLPLVCAPGEHLVGVHGVLHQWLERVGPICEPVPLDATDPATRVKRSLNNSADPVTPASTFSLVCEAGQSVSGIAGQTSGVGDRILGLRLSCATRFSDNSLTAVTATTASVGIDQTDNALPDQELSCPPASPAIGLFATRDDAGVGSLTLQCAG